MTARVLGIGVQVMVTVVLGQWSINARCRPDGRGVVESSLWRGGRDEWERA